MGKSIGLALYLATRARSDKAARDPDGHPTDSLGNSEKTLENERLGITSLTRPTDGPLIWFHTGQDRQGRAAQELAKRMLSERDDLGFLFTTSSEKRFKSTAYADMQLVPEETLASVRRFLDHWKPDVAVFSETDLRPALITETADRDIPLFLIDANTAKPDPQAWRWMRGMSQSLLSRFQRVMAGDGDSAAALRRLGADPERLEVSGFLEEGTPAMPCNETDRDGLAQSLAARPVWLAANVTEAELGAVLTAHTQAQRRAHRLLLILVPENPDLGRDWYDVLSADGHNVSLRSNGAEPDPDEQIYIADIKGEMGLWYRLSPISFLGQSLIAGGASNPYEPAALGSAIIHGPSVDNYAAAFARLDAAEAASLVRNVHELGDEVERLLSPDKAAGMAHKAWEICSSGAEVTDRVMDLILTELDLREGI